MSRKPSNMYRVTRRMMTLIEVLVATSILSILLVFLFGYYQHMITLNDQARVLREESFQIRYAQFRLSTAIPYATLRDEDHRFLPEIDRVFYTSDFSNEELERGSLLFVYHRGTEYLQGFSDQVIARLYLDNDNQLCLGIWKLPSRWKGRAPEMKREILMNHVTSLSFRFYVPPDHKKTIHPPEVGQGRKEIDPAPDQWHTEWLHNYSGLPAMVEVLITRKLPHTNEEEKIAFTYALIYTTRRIEYP